MFEFADEERQNGIHDHATTLAVSSILGLIDGQLKQSSGAVHEALQTLRGRVMTWYATVKEANLG